MIAGLIPARAKDSFLAVDLACGAGLLSETLLRAYPESRVVALDGSPAMLDGARTRLAPFGDRVSFGWFDLRGRGWLEALPDRVRCFVSSLAIHHLDGGEKQELFRDLLARLEPGGALLIADLVEPVNHWARETYAVAWDAAVRDQAREREAPAAYERMRQGWNYYVDPDVDFDKPSGLFEQLRWLREAGFSQVDCFWLRAGHAIYGGYR